MTNIAHATVVIDRPADEVFRYATNLEHFGEWFPGVVAIKSSDGADPNGVGKQYLETVKVPLRGSTKVLIEVKRCDAPTDFMSEGRMAPLLPRMIMKFEPLSATQTQLTWEMESRNRSKVHAVSTIPLARRIMQRRAEVGVQRLRDILEN